MNKAKYLNDVLTQFEAESMVQNLEKINMADMCSEKFIKHHAILEKLNMQSVKNALTGGEEYIMEYFVTYEKIKELIEELFITNSFKMHIYPLLRDQICGKFSMKTYIAMYHEAIIVNILENFFFHLTACQAADEYIVDILEYAYNKLTRLVNRKPLEVNKDITKISPEEDMDKKIDEIDHTISLACISILRYITDHITHLGFPVINHIQNVKDIPMLLVAIMECKPWLRKNDVEVYENNRWVKNTLGAKLPKLEGQVWITLFNLFMNQDNTKKYEITEFRRSNILRLRRYMNDQVFDQIPPLQQFYRSLEELSLMNVSSTLTNNPFVVEVIPRLINIKYDYESYAKKILKENYRDDTYKRELEIISDIFEVENLEYFMDDPKCANCGKDATNRCSRCKSEWYCGKDCQVKRWNLHKEICKNIAEMNKEKEIKKPEKKLDELD
jgi:predicted Zn-ribbon and HTH transcriptional regulator